MDIDIIYRKEKAIMEVIVVKQAAYSISKPNMANLRGKWGKSIIETIINTPKPDESKLRKEVEEIEKLMMAAERK